MFIRAISDHNEHSFIRKHTHNYFEILFLKLNGRGHLSFLELVRMQMRLLAIITLFLTSFSGYAQCVPNLTGPEFQADPDTIVNLPTAYFPSSYEATIQMYIPTDTFVDMLNLVLPLDSLFITGITGLPITFDYEVFPTAGPILGGTPICLQLTNPFVYQEEEGTHQLFIHVTAWSVGLPANGDITGYVLNVDPLPVGVNDAYGKILSSNVISKYLEIRPTIDAESLTILDARGVVVFEQILTGHRPRIDIEFLSDGIYFIQTPLGSSKFLKIGP